MKRPWLGGSSPHIADENEQVIQLRREAEERLSDDLDPASESPLPSLDLTHETLVHELRVHQLELEMQNDELRRTQSELIASRARFVDLYDSAPVGYLTLNERGVILDANLTATNLLGVPRAGLSGWPMFRFILAQDQDTFYLMRRSVVSPGEARVCDLRMVKPDGSSFWANLVAVSSTVPGDQGSLRVTMTDATARIQGELALRDHELQLDLAIRGGDLGLWDLDAVHQLLVVNDRWRTMLGLDPAGPPPTLGDWHARLHPDDAATLAHMMRDIMTEPNGSDFDDELRVRNDDGETRWILHKGAVVSRAADGRALRVVGILMDITKLKQAQEHAEATSRA